MKLDAWFAGKVALVTGAGDGIGRAGARLFAQRGAKVVVADVNRDKGSETVELIKADGGEAFLVDGDVTDKTAVEAFVRGAVETYGRLDYAFNNAGITHPNDGDWDDEAFEHTMNVNLFGVRHCLKYEIPEILKVGGGAIVNTASTAGFTANPAVPLLGYVTSKHAVIGLTKSVAVQYARSNIRVNALCPGNTLTALVRNIMTYKPEAKESLEHYSPMRRIANPEEMAEAAIWLCSDKSSFVTGHALVVDGGHLAT